MTRTIQDLTSIEVTVATLETPKSHCKGETSTELGCCSDGRPKPSDLELGPLEFWVPPPPRCDRCDRTRLGLPVRSAGLRVWVTWTME